MSAAVLAFPVLVAEPVAQVRRRGRLPASVRSLPAHRAECQRKAAEVAAARMKMMEKLCIDLMVRVGRGEVTGLAVIEGYDKKPDLVYISGHFIEDMDHLERCIYAFGNVVAESKAEKAKS